MRRWMLPAIAITALLACPSAWAGSPTSELRGFFATATRILEDPETGGKHEERLGAIRAVARRMFDLREAAQLSLGPVWGDRTPAEREAFVRVFSDLLERSFIAGIAARIRLSDGVKVSFTGESVDGPVATVHTTVLDKSGGEIPFDYRLIERDGRWAVRDVVIDGVSLVANYRAQFARVIQASSYRELFRQMQARVPDPPALVATAAADLGAVVPVTPAAPPSRPVSQEPPETRPGPQVAQTREVTEREPAMAAPVAPREPLEAILIARAELEPRPAAAPIDQEARPRQPEVATAAHPATVAATASALAYWVQVAAFRNLEAAMRLASVLRAEKTPLADRWAVVMAPGTAGAELARVRVGPFSDRAEAASNLRRLQARGYKPFIAEERD